MASISVTGPGRIQGELEPPGDKSISHRAVIFGALSAGTSHYSHFLEAEDCLSTLKAFQAMGVSFENKLGSGKLTIHGVGLSGLEPPKSELYLGNSGTSMRLILGVLAGQSFPVTLAGDPSLSSRPMRRVTDPLKKMGAQIKGRDQENFAPLTVRGGRLKGIDFDNKLASAQVKSAILLAGLYAEGQTRVRETVSSRDHTERFLTAAGAKFKKEGEWLVLEKTESLKPFSAVIPGDISSAAFFIAGAAMTPGSELRVRNVSLNPTRTGILQALKRMGASIEVKQTQSEPEPLGEITVQGRALQGSRITAEEIPSLIDELPVMITVMALAEGESLVSGAKELRVKETDRIKSMVTNLNALGGKLQELEDGCMIRGVSEFKGGKVTSFGDHRTAMSMAVASLKTQGGIKIEEFDCVNTSFPGFFAEWKRLLKA